jgi:hypothetical protein
LDGKALACQHLIAQKLAEVLSDYETVEAEDRLFDSLMEEWRGTCPEYIQKFGRRKCELNALFKNDRTLEAAEAICRNAIEKYYGKDAKERFKQKEEKTKQNLGEIYDNPIWQDFRENLDSLIESFSEKEIRKAQAETECKQETELDVFVDNKYYGNCPNCGFQFNYSKDDIGKLVRCRYCNAPLRLKWKGEEATSND